MNFKKLIIVLLLFIAPFKHVFAQNTYQNYSNNLNLSYFVNTQSGGGSLSVDIINDVISVEFSAGFSSSTLKLGQIAHINSSPNLPIEPIEMGSLGNGYSLRIVNGYMNIYHVSPQSPTIIESINVTLTKDLSTALAGPVNRSFSRVITARKDNLTEADFSINGLKENVTVATEYYDGLGRNIQSVIKQASPSGKDVVSIYEYDVFNRQSKQYLPFTAETSGLLKEDVETKISTFYSNTGDNVANSNYYYGQSSFDGSPLNIIEKKSTPGEDWRLNDGANTIIDLGFNSSADLIKKLVVSNNVSQTITVANYAENQLGKTEVTDENGNESVEFNDKRGRTICKKSIDGSGGDVITYYLYDYRGFLTFIVQPEGVRRMIEANDWTMINDPQFRTEWMFSYTYDGRGRKVEEQVPGADVIYYVYDDRDRLVLSQNGNQRKASAIQGDVEKSIYEGKSYILENNSSLRLKPGFSFSASQSNSFVATFDENSIDSKWTFYKYDQFNRVILTGEVDIKGSRIEVLGVVEDFYAISGGQYFENYSGTGSYRGYSNNSFPKNETYLINNASYYDGVNYPGTLPSGADDEVKGLVTGNDSRVLGTSNWLTSIVYYDDRQRVIEASRNNHIGGTDKSLITYENKVRNVVKKQVNTHTSATETPIVQTEKFTYDHLDRLQKVTHKINSQPEVTLTELSYNELSQVIEKDLGKVGTAPLAQSVDYQYNIKGWLTHINNGATSFDDGSDKFGMELQYNNSTAGHKQYNGNIGKMLWKTIGGAGLDQAQQDFSFTYDHLNRMKTAAYNKGRTSKVGFFDVSGNDNGIKYDHNGNILNLTRKYAGQLVDNLSYEYGFGSQLDKVSDATNDQGNFSDNADQSLKDYVYDANGNAVIDRNNSIASISYNYLNKPEKIVMESGDEITYQYDGNGIKLSRNDNGGAEMDYVGRFIYQNDNLILINSSEGRLTKSGSIYKYEYHLKDHLGNIRVTVDDGGNVIQRNDYYPFGLTFNSSIGNPQNYYKYNGVEQNPKTTLYETAFRGYDASIGRFNQVDPLTNKIPGISTYHFGFNNPIRFNDPLGLMGNDRTSFMNGRMQEWETHGERSDRENEEAFGNDNAYTGRTVKNNDGKDVAVTADDVLESYEIADIPPRYIIWEEVWANALLIDREYAYEYFLREKNTGTLASAIKRVSSGKVVSDMLFLSNLGLGGTSFKVVIDGKYHKWNEVWHKYKTTTAFRWQKNRWNNFGAKAIRNNQVAAAKGARGLSTKLGIASGVLILADVGLSGELKPSHGINAFMVGISFTGVGAIVAGVYFGADFVTMGVNLLVNGEAKGIGDLADEKFGTIKLYDGVY